MDALRMRIISWRRALTRPVKLAAMCYSAQVSQALRELARRYAADIDYRMFDTLLAGRLSEQGIDSSIKVCKALEANFLETSPDRDVSRSDVSTSADSNIRAVIHTYHQRLALKYQAELFTQRKRLADACRKLAAKPTKKALEDERIATEKIAAFKVRLADLQRTELTGEDSRVFPFWYVPVIVNDGGRRIIRPMRYHCRPAGKPATLDRRFDGLYNARKDSLGGFWKELFGTHHAVMVVSSFYENVARHAVEGRALRPGEQPQNVVLHFNPQPAQDMLIACLWSRWSEPGVRELYSFAAITDEPPPEIAAVGHDRCIIALREEHLDAWLTPQGCTASKLLQILSDPQRSCFEHRIAA
jgi:putative SOS response-associated peptidase YedK